MVTEVGTRSVERKAHDEGSGTTNNTTHETTSNTDLLLCFQAIEGNENPHPTTPCTYDGVGLTLVRDTGSTGDNGDVRVLVYGMVSPGANTATGVMQTEFNAFPMIAVWININGVDTSSVAAATNFLSEDVNTAVSPTSVLASAGDAGNGLLVWGVAQHSGMNPSAFDSGFTEIIEGTTSATASDFAYNLSSHFAGSPSGGILTWNTTNENTAVLIELVASSVGIVQQAASHYRNQGKVF